jgi:hypothetical protein
MQALQDSAAQVAASQAHAVDSVTTRPSFSDPVIAVVQFLFQQPPFVMWGGVVLGAIVAAVLAVVLWRRRRKIGFWLRTRSAAVKAAMAGTVVLLAWCAPIPATIPW